MFISVWISSPTKRFERTLMIDNLCSASVAAPLKH
jgi:hypothetical protein